MFILNLCIGLLGFVFYNNSLNYDYYINILNPIEYETNLFVAGDIMLSRRIGYENKEYGYDRIFGIGSYNPMLKYNECKNGKCVGFGNLESLFNENDNDHPKGGFSFRANPKNVQVLNELKGDNKLVLSIANNHTNNVWKSGMEQTLDILKKNGITSVGGGLNPEQSHLIKKVRSNGIDLCFGAYSYDGGYKRGIAWNSINEKNIKQDLEKMKKQNCDVKIISLHWGREYKIYPLKSQINLAHSLIDSGVDIIVGGHSHVPGKIEKYKGKYIFYSMGNFIFDQNWGMKNFVEKINMGVYDGIYDAVFGRKGVPTYIALNSFIKIKKKGKNLSIKIDSLETSRIDYGIHSKNDKKTNMNVVQTIYPEYPLSYFSKY